MSAARKKPQLSRHARGYTNAHVARRRQLEPLVATGQVSCYRCGQLIEAGQPWHSRPPRRPPRLPRPLPRNLQPPRCCREDERQEQRPSPDLVTGLVRAGPAKRHSQRQRRRRRNPRFLSLRRPGTAPAKRHPQRQRRRRLRPSFKPGKARYRAVPFLPPMLGSRWHRARSSRELPCSCGFRSGRRRSLSGIGLGQRVASTNGGLVPSAGR
jgi:hypothetical protein